MQMLLTILGAIAILVLGQLIIKFIMEPIQEHRKLRGRILSDLIFYANVYNNPGWNPEQRAAEASATLRRHAADLISASFIIPFYRAWAAPWICVKRENIKLAHKDLIFLSNSTGSSGKSDWNKDAQKRIEKALSIDWFRAD